MSLNAFEPLLEAAVNFIFFVKIGFVLLNIPTFLLNEFVQCSNFTLVGT